MKSLAQIVILLVAFVLGSQASGEDISGDVDFVLLATQLYRDGHFDRAESVLQSVRPEDLTEQRDEYFTLLALLALRRSDYEPALALLQEALGAGRTENEIYVQFAQVYWGLEDWKMVVQSIHNAGVAAEPIPELHLMKSQALWRLNRKTEALEALDHGAARFPQSIEFERQRVFLLLELGLNQAAVERANAYISRSKPDARDFLALGEGLRRNGDIKTAIHYLEKARLLFPEDPTVVVKLAQAWVADDKPMVAADLYQRASDIEPRFVIESAELYRRAGAFERALFMNAQISDQRPKLRQRIGILVDMGRFEDVAQLQERAQRLGCLDDDGVRYAIAFANFKTGDFERCESLLKGIRDVQFFKAATQLRAAIAHCGADPFRC